MKIISTIAELRAWRKSIDKVAFVPTMGNLHSGHLSLVREAKKYADHVVVSIFVNPLQFGEGEDFATYPRTLQADTKKLEKAGVNIVFIPSADELYSPQVPIYHVEPPALQNELCGRFRPGHFRGVTTVVSKLFHIVEPNIACFGKKDYQQLIILQGMVNALNFPIQIIGVEIERASDGLALSSRNGYLSEAERQEAPYLYQTLQTIAQAIEAGSRNFSALILQAKQQLESHNWKVDYIEVRRADNLEPAQADNNAFVILAGAYLGKTRLIDNIVINIKK